MIVPVQVQLKGENEPQQHLALVFPDMETTEDFIAYRNAATGAAKAILECDEVSSGYTTECFFLLQLAEFISDSLDRELTKRKKSHEEP